MAGMQPPRYIPRLTHFVCCSRLRILSLPDAGTSAAARVRSQTTIVRLRFQRFASAPTGGWQSAGCWRRAGSGKQRVNAGHPSGRAQDAPTTWIVVMQSDVAAAILSGAASRTIVGPAAEDRNNKGGGSGSR